MTYTRIVWLSDFIYKHINIETSAERWIEIENLLVQVGTRMSSFLNAMHFGLLRNQQYDIEPH